MELQTRTLKPTHTLSSADAGFRWLRFYLKLLVCLLVFLAVPSLITWWVTFKQVEQRELARAPEQHQLIAKMVSEHINGYVVSQTRRFLTIAQSPMPQVTAQAAALPEYMGICRYDARVTTVSGHCPTSLDTANWKNIQVDTQNLILSGVQVVNGTPVVMVGQMHADTLVVGLLSTAAVLGIQSGVKFGQNAHALIVDHTGHVIAHPNPNWVASAKDVSKIEAVKLVLSQNYGVTRFYSPAFNTDMIAGFAQIEELGWGVVVPQPITELTEVAKRAALNSTLPTIASLGVFLSCFLLLTLLIERLLARIRTTVEEISPELQFQSSNSGRFPLFGGGFTNLTDRIKEISQRLSETHQIEQRYRKQLEKNLEIARTLAASEQQRRELVENSVHKDRLEALGQVVGSVAHDFNNFLSIIRAHAEAIEGKTSADIGGSVQEIIHATQRGKSLTKQLLSSGGRIQSEPKLVNPCDAVKSALSSVRSVIPDRITIEQRLPYDCHKILVDPDQLQTALLNLIMNSVDAIDGAGSITISVQNLDFSDRPRDPYRKEKPKHCLRITVKDTGCGMTKDQLQRACEPFYTTKTFGAGTGLGLPMASGFAKQSSGCLRIESDLGAGSRVHLTFPGQLHDEETRPVRKAKVAKVAAEKLLLVEDETALRLILKSLFEAHGFTVTAVESGDDAVRLLETNYTPDVVVTDMVMPGDVQGEGVVQEVRAKLGALPIVLMSGYSDAINRYEIEFLGPIKFASKPVTATHIVGLIAELEQNQ